MTPEVASGRRLFRTAPIKGSQPGICLAMSTLFDGLGQLGRTYRTVDWERTPLGPVSSWSDTLLNAVDLMLHTRFPIVLLWGPEFVLVYNEAYVHLIGDKHPGALGKPASEVFSEVWDLIGPMMQAVLDGEGANWVEDQYVPLHRHGFLEECYFTFSYSPVRNRDGVVEGVMDIAAETTEQVISRRRMQTLRRLTERLADVQNLEDVPSTALPVLRADPQDFPVVDIRLPGLAGAHIHELPSHPTDPGRLGSEVVEKYGDGQLAWLPLGSNGSAEASYLVVLLSPLLAPAEQYLGFLRLVAAALRQALDRVRVRGAERRAAEVQRGISEAFQRSLLPEPVGSGHPEVAVRYQPAAELAHIGGDWYDLFELPDRSLTVVIGDVAGHDQQAAAAMAQVRNMSRGVAYTMHPDSPSRVLQALDRAMLGTGQDVVATAVLAQVARTDSQAPNLRWSNAGHPPPALIEPDGRTRLLETAPDLLLGLDAGTRRADHRITLRPGATLVFYTDGLVERRGTPLAAGLAQLVEVLRDRQHTAVEDLCSLLLQDVDGDDDVALLIMRT